MNERNCNVDKCNRNADALGMCNLHYQRKINGRPLIQPVKVELEHCTVLHCEKPPRSRYATMCAMHYHRVYRYGSIRPTHPPRYEDITGRRFNLLTVESREADGRWLCRCDCGKTIVTNIGNLNNGNAQTCGDKKTHYRNARTYSAAHGRVRQDHGSASQYPCVDCNGPARHWSYSHLDPAEERDWSMKGAPYFSTDPSFYEPRCVSCHKHMDLQIAARRSLADR